MFLNMLNFRTVIKATKLLRANLTPKQLSCTCKRSTETQPAVQVTEETYKKQLKDFETLTNISRKPRQKKPQRPPFAKNLLAGKFDTEILTYPELEKEDVDNLEKYSIALSKLLKQEHMATCKSLSEKHFRQNLSDYKMIGLQASQFLDGKECNYTEFTKYLETLCEHNLGESIVYNEQLGAQVLVKFGSENLQKKILYPLMKGELLTAFCINEPRVSDSNSLKTSAVISEDGKNWILNGEKCWVINGNSADVFIVFAVSKVISRDVFQEIKFSTFLVDKNSSGITITKDIQSNIDSTTVKFTDVIVPAENVIGEVNNGEAIIKTLMNEFRLTTGTMCVSLTKKIIQHMMQDILKKSDGDNLLYKTDAVREKIGKALMGLYAMESILYLTTGLMDTYENQDCELECALVKIFCSNEAFRISSDCLDMIGPPAMDTSHWAHKFHEDSIRYLTLPQNNDTLTIIAALNGLQHAGVEKQALVEKIRNPFFNTNFNIIQSWKYRRDKEDRPILDLKLGDYLHPSCLAPAERLEYSVKRLGFVTELVLIRHGGNIVNAHMDLRRIITILLDIYVMTAVLGRASRSYCIGLQNAFLELVVSTAFCNDAKKKIQAIAQEILHGDYVTNDDSYKSISKNLFKFKEYYFKHPLTRNF